MCFALKALRKPRHDVGTCIRVHTPTQTVVWGSCLNFVIGFLHVVHVCGRFIRKRGLSLLIVCYKLP